jgi:hypothetical protein
MFNFGQGEHSVQAHQPRLSREEAALFIKGFEVRFIIHMQPVNPTFPRPFRCPSHQLNADTLSLKIRMHSRIQQKSMDAPIPGDIHKANQLLLVIRADIEQTVTQDGLKIPVGVFMPGGTKQPIEFIVTSWGADVIVDSGHEGGVLATL